MLSYHRTTITIPLDIKRRMDAVMENVNWSKVASDAFMAKLDEIEERQRIPPLPVLLARLKSVCVE
jgi:hypothetical protein